MAVNRAELGASSRFAENQEVSGGRLEACVHFLIGTCSSLKLGDASTQKTSKFKKLPMPPFLYLKSVFNYSTSH